MIRRYKQNIIQQEYFKQQQMQSMSTVLRDCRPHYTSMPSIGKMIKKHDRVCA